MVVMSRRTFLPQHNVNRSPRDARGFLGHLSGRTLALFVQGQPFRSGRKRRCLQPSTGDLFVQGVCIIILEILAGLEWSRLIH